MSAETLADLDPRELRDSPFQPRRHYADIDGLAANIQAEGRIHQRLLVRPLLANVLRPDEHSGYEIVFGHRRKRAAVVAGLATVPVTIRHMSNAEVRSAQMAENVQRDNMRALEEAAGLKQMLDDGLSAAELATRAGKSESWVRGRLRLLDLVPEVRQALDAGDVQAEVALYVARVGGPDLQKKALAEIKRSYHTDLQDGGARSVRAIRALLNEKFTLTLADAIFDTTNAHLVPGVGACGPCPKRSGNAAEFADVAGAKSSSARYSMTGDEMRADDAAGILTLRYAGPDLCTDPDCFAAKKREHLARQADQLRAAGKSVVTGAKAKAALGEDGHPKRDAAYIELSAVRKAIKSKQADVPTVVLQDPRTGKTVEAVARVDAEAHGLVKPATSRKASSSGAQRDWAAERKEHEAAQATEMLYRRRLYGAVRERMMGRARDRNDLALIVAALLQQNVFAEGENALRAVYGRTSSELGALADTMTPDQLALLLLDLVLVPTLDVQWDIDEGREILDAAAQAYDVDAAALRAAMESADTRTIDMLETA